MANLFRAFLFKLRHDLAFRITLIIGIALAVFSALLFLLIGVLVNEKLISGEMMFISSLSPTQNFGLAIPINLIVFTVGEFTHGSIRNKIIAGYSKAKIYASLCINGLFFAFSLLLVYVLLCLGLGCLFGGYSGTLRSFLGFGYASDYVPKLLLIAILSYVSITSFTVFFSALFRSIGPAIPVVIIVILFAAFAGTIASSFADKEALIWIARIIDPLYAFGAGELLNVGESQAVKTVQTITNETLICGCLSNVAYAIGFFLGGMFLFKKRDVK